MTGVHDFIESRKLGSSFQYEDQNTRGESVLHQPHLNGYCMARIIQSIIYYDT